MSVSIHYKLLQGEVAGSDEERALRRKRRKEKDDRFKAVKSAIIKRLGDTCDVSLSLKNQGKSVSKGGR